MLSIAKLRVGQEAYQLSGVAQSLDDYYTGAGEASGVWVGGGADRLGLDGEVDADDLRRRFQMENKSSSQDRVPRVQRGSAAPPRTSTPSRVTMTIAEAALLLGLSESATYEAAARGEIPAIRIGRRVLVKRDQLLVMLGDVPPTAETA